MCRWKKYLSVGLIGVLCLTGCGQKKEEDSVFTIEQNDYAGGYYRSQLLVKDVESIINTLADHNYMVQLENPSDYWVEDDFYHVDFAGFQNNAMDDISLINETEDFVNVQTYVSSVIQNRGYRSPTILRKEKDNYQITYSGNFINEYDWSTIYATRTLLCKYDAGNNRLQVLSSLKQGAKEYEDFLYEFAEVDKGIYVMQTDLDRLYVIYNDDREIESFYYSRLMEEEIQEEEIKEDEIQSDLELILNGFPTAEELYDTKFRTEWKNSELESIFLNLYECNKDWVFEKSNTKTQIAYENNTLSVQTKNDLTGEIYSFSFEKPKDELVITETVTETLETVETTEETKNAD